MARTLVIDGGDLDDHLVSLKIPGQRAYMTLQWTAKWARLLDAERGGFARWTNLKVAKLILPVTEEILWILLGMETLEDLMVSFLDSPPSLSSKARPPPITSTKVIRLRFDFQGPLTPEMMLLLAPQLVELELRNLETPDMHAALFQYAYPFLNTLRVSGAARWGWETITNFLARTPSINNLALLDPSGGGIVRLLTYFQTSRISKQVTIHHTQGPKDDLSKACASQISGTPESKLLAP